MKKVLILFILFLSINLYSNSYKYLELGIDARSFVLGPGAINIVKGSGSTLINPAGIDAYRYNWLLVSHLEWMFDSSMENFEIGFPVGKNFYSSAGVIYFSTADFDIFNNNGDVSYTFKSYDLAVYGGIGKNFGLIKLGANGKILKKKLGDYDGTGFSSDFGIRLFGNLKDKISINIVVKNILYVPVKMITFENEITTYAKVGIRYSIFRALDILAAAKIGKDKPEFNGSLKYNLFNVLNIYSGYSISNFSAVGAGITYKYVVPRSGFLFFDLGFLKMFNTELGSETPFRISVRYLY